MEKLRTAIDKARKSRDRANLSSGGKASASSGGRVPPSDPTEDLWKALTPLDVDDKHLVEQRVVTRAARKAATPFDILRTKTLLQMRQNGWTRLAITSPMPSSGKTTTACNLALGLGRQQDLKSILFDLDLRDPSVNSFFQTNPKYSINEMLAGRVTFEQQAHRFGDNVAISMAQGPDLDPTQTLLAEETSEKLDSIVADYEPDVVIFDLPSVLVNDDSRAFLKNADCALIVVRGDSTHYGQFEKCRREVAEHTNVLGVVLNAYRYDKRTVETG